jgi:ribosomal protein S7
MPFHKILVLCFLKLNTLVEVREINSNRRTIFVPFYITFERRLYLVFKWILTAVSEDKRKISFSDKLADEIYNIVSDKTCRSMELKKDNLKKSISYRSNIHYRW